MDRTERIRLHGFTFKNRILSKNQEICFLRHKLTTFQTHGWDHMAGNSFVTQIFSFTQKYRATDYLSQMSHDKSYIIKSDNSYFNDIINKVGILSLPLSSLNVHVLFIAR